MARQHEVRPHWPYKNADGRKKDEEVFLPAPIIEDGVWHLSSDDIQCLSIGCGILGSGGGGPPAMCKQLAIEGWLEGKHLKIYNPYHKRLSEGDLGKTMFCVVGLDGNPKSVHSADGIGVMSTTHAFKVVQQALASGVCNPANGDGEIGTDNVRVTKETIPERSGDVTVACLANTDDLKKVNIGPDARIPKEHRLAGIFNLETGAVNTMAPIRCASEMATDKKDEFMFIDFGAEGRAVPKLSMWLPFLHGIKPYPSALSNADGSKLVCCTHVDTADKLENFFRAKIVEMGGNAGISFGVMSLHDIYSICIPYAISHAWELGRTVIRATRMKRDPVVAVLSEEKGSVTIITGKILELEKPKNKEPGFHSVYIKIAGIDKYAGHIVVARAQNEIYAALNNDDKNAKMYGCTPDSISMVDPTTGIPVTASTERKELIGNVVSLICILSNPKLKSPKKIIEAVGPSAYQDLVKLGFTAYQKPRSVLEV